MTNISNLVPNTATRSEPLRHTNQSPLHHLHYQSLQIYSLQQDYRADRLCELLV